MKAKRLILIAAVILAGAALVSEAEDANITLRAYADRRTIFIGDRIKYTIEVKYKDDVEVEPLKFADDRIGDFEIKDSLSSLKKRIFGGYVLRSLYQITAYSAGKQTIPQIDVRYRQKNKPGWLVRKTVPIEVFVNSVLPRESATADIKDIKGPLWFREINWIVISGVGAALLALAMFVIAYRRRKRRAILRLPHETALEELEAVKGLFAKSADVKGYYVGVSDCVRRYIERVFALKAPEMTTEEFLESLKDSQGLSPEQKDLLKEFLKACDLVKFAKYLPATSEIESVYTAAKNFVEQTKDAFRREKRD